MKLRNSRRCRSVLPWHERPAMARQVISGPGHYAQSIYCATREAGNPYSKYCDYIAWSGSRRRGGWDSQLDNACLRNPGYKPAGCWP